MRTIRLVSDLHAPKTHQCHRPPRLRVVPEDLVHVAATIQQSHTRLVHIMTKTAGPSNSSQQPSGEPISWPDFDNSLQYMLPGASLLSVPNDGKKVRLSWLIPADFLGYESGLYALAIGMAADPDRTEAIDWEGRSPENTAFARLIDAVQQIRSRPLDKRNVGLEMSSAGGSTVAFHHLVVLIDYCNENPYEPEIDLSLAGRGCIETKTPHFQDCKKTLVRRNPDTLQWEGCGYAESAHGGTYRYQHEESADVYEIDDEESRSELHETPGDGKLT